MRRSLIAIALVSATACGDNIAGLPDGAPQPWPTEVVVTADDAVLAITEAGAMHVVYRAGDSRLFHTIRTADGWSDGAPVALPEDTRAFALAASGEMLHLVWQDGDELYYAQHAAGAGWMAPVSATAPYGDRAGRTVVLGAVLAHPDGDVLVTYGESRGNAKSGGMLQARAVWIADDAVAVEPTVIRSATAANGSYHCTTRTAVLEADGAALVFGGCDDEGPGQSVARRPFVARQAGPAWAASNAPQAIAAGLDDGVVEIVQRLTGCPDADRVDTCVTYSKLTAADGRWDDEELIAADVPMPTRASAVWLPGRVVAAYQQPGTGVLLVTSTGEGFGDPDPVPLVEEEVTLHADPDTGGVLLFHADGGGRYVITRPP
ncbi:MAG TPA: hypothetical protein VMZ28_05585 [Kofleriaceae bacterium]|nr:hypothetical protein [Kofleriaceae bacterium]